MISKGGIKYAVKENGFVVGADVTIIACNTACRDVAGNRWQRSIYTYMSRMLDLRIHKGIQIQSL